jgi:hypothetical protein
MARRTFSKFFWIQVQILLQTPSMTFLLVPRWVVSLSGSVKCNALKHITWDFSALLCPAQSCGQLCRTHCHTPDTSLPSLARLRHTYVQALSRILLCSTFCLPRFCLWFAPGRQKLEHMFVLPFVYLGFTSVLHRYCPASKPQQSRCKTDAKPRLNRGRQKVEHLRVLPFVYLDFASVLPRFYPAS